MRVLICDRCGTEHRSTGVVSKALDTAGYEEWAAGYQFKLNGRTVVDVCKSCFKAATSAKSQAEADQRASVKAHFLRIIGAEK
jgi:hypothetical protein